MPFNSIDTLLAALPSASDQIHNKTGFASQTVGQFASLWRAFGNPAQGAVPGAAAVCTDALAGAFSLPARTGLQQRAILYLSTTMPIQQGYVLVDRLAHMGGLSGIVTTAQTVSVDVSGAGSNLPARIADTLYRNVRWFLEWYTTTGATVVNATCAVTYSDNSTGNIVVALPASVAAARMIEIVSPGPLAIKAVNTVTLSATTGTAGSFGVTAMRVLADAFPVAANVLATFDWAALGLPLVEDSACLTPVIYAFASTNIGNTTARFKIGVA